MSVERVFVGDDEQYFPDLCRWVAPGDSVEFEVDPEDPRFVTAAKAKPIVAEIHAARKRMAKAEPVEPAPEAPQGDDTTQES